MNVQYDLTHHFLIAMPSLQDINFSRSVIFIEDHSDEGTIGLIINKPLQITLGTVLTHLKLATSFENVAQHSVLMGGPIGQDQGFVLHRSPDETDASDKIQLSSSKELLRLISNNSGPQDFLITLGYSGWEPGQLEEEIVNNDWLSVQAAPSILFDTPIEQRWVAAIGLLGIDVNSLSDQSGHA